MKTIIDENKLFRLAEASVKSVCRAHIASAVSRHFKSMHYLSSRIICDCVTLNILLNDNITPCSADEIITCMRRRNKSLYTTVDSAFFPIEDRFEEHAKVILGNRYAEIKLLNLRNTNYIVFVLSTDLKNNYDLYPEEIYYLAYSYKELTNIKLPHY